MLTTIIYRSHLTDEVPVSILPGMVEKASLLNARHQVTGILLFNGTHFFQILEGPEEGVLDIYGRICADRRHHNVVELMRDYSPSRRFGNHGMELFDLRHHDSSSVLQAVLDRGTSKYRLTYDDRGLQFLRTFVEAREKENYFEVLPADYWDFVPDDKGSPAPAAGVTFRPAVRSRPLRPCTMTRRRGSPARRCTSIILMRSPGRCTGPAGRALTTSCCTSAFCL